MLKTTDETIDITQQTPHMSLACGEFKFKIHKPCCSGQWSRTNRCRHAKKEATACLNPCCSGQWSRTGLSKVNAKSLEKS